MPWWIIALAVGGGVLGGVALTYLAGYLYFKDMWS